MQLFWFLFFNRSFSFFTFPAELCYVFPNRLCECRCISGYDNSNCCFFFKVKFPYGVLRNIFSLSPLLPPPLSSGESIHFGLIIVSANQVSIFNNVNEEFTPVNKGKAPCEWNRKKKQKKENVQSVSDKSQTIHLKIHSLFCSFCYLFYTCIFTLQIWMCEEGKQPVKLLWVMIAIFFKKTIYLKIFRLFKIL